MCRLDLRIFRWGMNFFTNSPKFMFQPFFQILTSWPLNLTSAQVSPLSDFLESSTSDCSPYLLDDKTLAKYGEILDIVTASDRRSCCFTKGYASYFLHFVLLWTASFQIWSLHWGNRFGHSVSGYGLSKAMGPLFFRLHSDFFCSSTTPTANTGLHPPTKKKLLAWNRCDSGILRLEKPLISCAFRLTMVCLAFFAKCSYRLLMCACLFQHSQTIRVQGSDIGCWETVSTFGLSVNWSSFYLGVFRISRSEYGSVIGLCVIYSMNSNGNDCTLRITSVLLFAVAIGYQSPCAIPKTNSLS